MYPSKILILAVASLGLVSGRNLQGPAYSCHILTCEVTTTVRKCTSIVGHDLEKKWGPVTIWEKVLVFETKVDPGTLKVDCELDHATTLSCTKGADGIKCADWLLK